jgi:hypothetical protein
MVGENILLYIPAFINILSSWTAATSAAHRRTITLHMGAGETPLRRCRQHHMSEAVDDKHIAICSRLGSHRGHLLTSGIYTSQEFAGCGLGRLRQVRLRNPSSPSCADLIPHCAGLCSIYSAPRAENESAAVCC